MPECQNCHETWNWKQTFKRLFTLGGGMECPYCHEYQYQTSTFRKRSALIPVILMSIIMLGNLLWGPSYLSLLVLLGTPLIFMLICPFFVKLSNEDEALW